LFDYLTVLYFLRKRTEISSKKANRFAVRFFSLDVFLAFGFQGSPPKFAVGGKARYEGIEIISLCVAEIPVVGDPFNERLEPRSTLKRRALRRAIKEDVEINFQPSYIVLHARELLVDLRYLFGL
jgi:hypothetical protein